MAPESERAMNCTGCEHPQHVGGECHAFVDLPLGTPYCDCQIHTEPTLTCSEVVERLPLDSGMDNSTAYRLGKIAREAGTLGPDKAGDEIDRGLILVRLLNEAGFAILHSWRERRVQELEKLLGWSTDSLRGCLPLVQGNGYRDSSDKIKEGLKVCDDALTNSEWREQIGKGAKHEPK